MGSHHVEVAGIEPASFSFSVGLLRAHLVIEFRTPPRHQQRSVALADQVSPSGLPARPLGQVLLDVVRIRPAGLRPVKRRYCLGSECELRLGVCCWFRLFNVAPETTARFSHLDYRSRDQSPPWLCRLPILPAVHASPTATARRSAGCHESDAFRRGADVPCSVLQPLRPLAAWSMPGRQAIRPSGPAAHLLEPSGAIQLCPLPRWHYPLP